MCICIGYEKNPFHKRGRRNNIPVNDLLDNPTIKTFNLWKQRELSLTGCALLTKDEYPD